jgi:hypothetical protein
MLGWVIKYIISVKENYFGDHSHFVSIVKGCSFASFIESLSGYAGRVSLQA